MSHQIPSSMSDKAAPTQGKIVFYAQLLSMSLIWVFVVGISVWIINLLLLSIELQDVPGASIGISIVAIPVFLTLAGVLTYVFVGLQKKDQSSTTPEEK